MPARVRRTGQTLYDHAHVKARRQYEPLVASGNATCTEPICLEPTRNIHPTAPWDLAHHPQGGYRGPAHPRCNRAEGARRGNTNRHHARRLPRW